MEIKNSAFLVTGGRSGLGGGERAMVGGPGSSRGYRLYNNQQGPSGR